MIVRARHLFREFGLLGVTSGRLEIWVDAGERGFSDRTVVSSAGSNDMNALRASYIPKRKMEKFEGSQYLFV